MYFGEVVAIKKLQSGKCDPSLFGLFFRCAPTDLPARESIENSFDWYMEI